MTTDQLLVRQAIDGNEQALQQLWMQYAPHVDAVILRLCGDRDLAADIAQEVWMQVFRALPSYRGGAQLGTWIHRVAVNRTLNLLRKVRRIAGMETQIAEDTALAVSDTERDTDRTLMAESISQAVQQLPPGARTIFTLHDIEGYTHEEIAHELGITPSGSKSQLFKARVKLRRLLAHLVDQPPAVAVALSHVGRAHDTSF